jgi:hypothetical protein
MIEDKLNQTQRIRLEALAQAVACSKDGYSEGILDKAHKFEMFILLGKRGI